MSYIASVTFLVKMATVST